MLAETEKAWMAGFVDGEGCLTITKQIRKDRISPTYRVLVEVFNTDPQILEIFPKQYGGKIQIYRERRRNRCGVKWKDSNCWYCPISSVRQFLLDILPYLKLKRKHAGLLLQFIDRAGRFADRRGRRKDGAPEQLTQKEIALREKYYLKLHSLTREANVGVKNDRDLC